MIDFFFQNQWRRLSATYSERSIARHQRRLMIALYARRSAQRAP